MSENIDLQDAAIKDGGIHDEAVQDQDAIDAIVIPLLTGDLP